MGKLIDYLHQSVQRSPDAVAIGGGATPLTYRVLWENVTALAAAFQKLNPERASRVGICARNNRQHLLSVLATYASGKVWVPLNPRNGQPELEAMTSATKPTLLVVDAEFADRFSSVDAQQIVSHSIDDLIESHRGQVPETFEGNVTDAQIIKFSGGSTGAPKAVVQSTRCVDAQARAILDFFEFTPNDVNLIAAPLTHGASCFVLPIFAASGRHILVEDPKAANILDAIELHGVTTVYAPPTLIYAMLAEQLERPRDVSSLTHLIYSAAPMPSERIRDVQRVFGPIIETAYGLVEAPQIITAMRGTELARDENLASVGRPSSVVTVRIVRPDGSDVPSGEMGEIAVQGPLLMNGYLDRPEQTAETIVDGWLRTGDLGLIDRRGYVFIKGRMRELINSGGFKVMPADVESVLARHESVAECCVFGVADEKWGEAVHAAVRLVPGAQSTGSDLINFVKRELDSVKAPKQVHFVDELPRNAAGKVSRSAVREMVAAQAKV